MWPRGLSKNLRCCASYHEYYDFQRTNDPKVYSLVVSRSDPKEDAWEPYSDIKDTQLEFTILDPHIRTALPPVAGRPGVYSTQIRVRVRDRHSMFKSVIDYEPKGWTYLHHSITVAVVPPRHDGYPRILGAA
ncbi:Oligosaccharyltransferase 48 kDa subunit beta-domain-containing protein [Armillaria borealis]|uniref:Oligosaccharyltransferase 48 kDa subunit beta-domain-containing protein n=1 Tax=Armillaria borealis TaxID=47425 RepID=A0AA39JJI9_9AGAR|nr:Oligosaccharyltransferase 48 kDa subunit beta-domain-containing protein [Armillaria borealis]